MELCFVFNASSSQYSSCPLDGSKVARFKVHQMKNNVKSLCLAKCCERELFEKHLFTSFTI